MRKDEALKKLQAVKAYMTSGNPIWDVKEIAEAFDIAIEALSASEPERKTGKWIRHPEWEADGECGYECDQCGMGSDVDYNFCMRCGAKMEV